ncbi:zinc-binding dehydrogenase [Schlesneria sp. T3-172]|uniref:zinc-dependent alcohol dehydrogenase n=1 Tax=Schlesneria sphaerica TaxID=3373610 RepID=UPI0037CCB181
MLIGDMYAPGKVRLIEVPEPVLPSEPPHGCSGQIVFQPETTCLCGSDLPYFNGWNEWPIALGHSLHEMIGTVVATNGKKWKTGDRVLAVPVAQQGLAERFILDENRAISVATNVPEEQALMAQPLGTVIFALKKLPSLLDRDVVVVGQGPMGQLFNAALRNLGARQVIGIDLVQGRLETSPQMGATATICNANTDPVTEVKKILGGRLPDVVIECVGHADQQFNLCIDLCRPEGQILFFGVPPEKINDLRWRDLFFKNISVYTSVGPDFSRDFPSAMQWIKEGRINVAPIITHRFPLRRLQESFELFRDRKEGVLKVIVTFPALGK